MTAYDQTTPADATAPPANPPAERRTAAASVESAKRQVARTVRDRPAAALAAAACAGAALGWLLKR